jgi:hypothetical protein
MAKLLIIIFKKHKMEDYQKCIILNNNAILDYEEIDPLYLENNLCNNKIFGCIELEDAEDVYFKHENEIYYKKTLIPCLLEKYKIKEMFDDTYVIGLKDDKICLYYFKCKMCIQDIILFKIFKTQISMDEKLEKIDQRLIELESNTVRYIDNKTEYS